MSRATTKPLPANLPPLPPVPAGYDAWEYHEFLEGKQTAPWTRLVVEKWHPDTSFDSSHELQHDNLPHFLRAVKRPAKASAAKKTRKVDASDFAGSGDFDRTVHPRSCINCTQCWHHDPEYGEGGKPGWVCDGRNGAHNLKSFPFRTEQACFTGPAKKTPKPERKAGRVVAKRMYQAPSGVIYGSYAAAQSGGGWEPSHLFPIDCLPADEASVERMANQVAEDVVDALFLHGAERLQLRDANEKDLGGWCRGAVVDQVKAHALAAIGIAATGKGERK